MLIILLFLLFIFLANSFDKYAGALKFVLKCLPQLSVVKFSNLSLSNSEALFIKQSKNFNFFLQNLTIFSKSGSLLRSPFIKYTFVEFLDNFFLIFQHLILIYYNELQSLL